MYTIITFEQGDTMAERTTFLRTVVIRDGSFGNTQSLYLCEGLDGVVWGVYRSGYLTFADPCAGISPLPTVTP